MPRPPMPIVFVALASTCLILWVQQAEARPPEPPPEDMNENAWISLLTPKTIFVTSAQYTGNLVLEAQLLGATGDDPLAAADFICKYHAETASLTGNYVAILSTSTVNANARLTTSLGPYRLVTGTPVAASYAALFGTEPSLDSSTTPIPAKLLMSAVHRDEFGVDREHPSPTNTPTGVWTGSNRLGEVESFRDGSNVDQVFPGASTCFDWTSADEAVGSLQCDNPEIDYNCAIIGTLELRGSQWIATEREGCETLQRLYCAER